VEDDDDDDDKYSWMPLLSVAMQIFWALPNTFMKINHPFTHH